MQAPILIFICGIPSRSWRRSDDKNYWEVDVTIAMDHLILAAADIGLGTCWIGAFSPDTARHILDLPYDVEPLVFTPLGYLDDQPRYKNRKRISELARYELW